MNRRQFLHGAGAALVGGVIAPASLSLDPLAVQSSLSANDAAISAVVFDERYRDSTLFAAALVFRGAKPFDINGNSAALWCGPLRRHLNSAPGRIAGLTTESDRGVSLASGRELSLKLVYEGAHDARRSTSIAHRISAAENQDEIATSLRRPRLLWSESLAYALHLAKFPASPLGASLLAAANQSPVIATTPLSRDFPGYLTSWLLAPSA